MTAHRPTPPGSATPVELVLLPQEREEGSSLSAEEARLFEADLIAERLHHLQRSAFPVWDKDDGSYRPFRYDDAAVLFRATTDVPLYEERFRAAGLPYLTVSGRGYYDRPEIRDLVSLLAALHNPYDDLSLAAALRSPLFSLSDETLYRLRRRTADGRCSPRSVPLVSALAAPPPTDQPERVAHAAAVLGELWDLAGRVDVCHLLRRALDRTGYQAVLALEDASEGGGGRRHANLEKLLRLAYERGGDGLSAFLRHVSLLREREVREGEAAAAAPEAGAVQLMSVHAAKGLEFPVVAVADLGRAPGGGARTPRVMGDPAYGLVCMDRNEDGDWVKPAGYAWAEWLDGRMERAESNRVLYVACTRAADLLLLFGRPAPGDNWLARVMRAWELAPEGPEEEIIPYPGFAVRIRRPANVKADTTPGPVSGATQPGGGGSAHGRTRGQPQDTCLPAAVAALPPRPPRSVAVTSLARLLGREPEPLPPVRPRSDGSIGLEIGRLVHRALDHWDCLSEPYPALQARLEAWATRRGLDATTARRVAGAVHRCLREFWRSALYRAASRCRERHTELPFALQAGQTTIRGALDLLYRDDEGRWHLVDWKTDYVTEDEVLVQAPVHRLQLAVYARAASVVTGEPPTVSVCFLRPRVRVMSFQTQELTQEWEALVRALEGLGAGVPAPPE
ncbi:MAG: hypothetical protein HPY83_18305 [Anaerolineae bacterium]|nr:hypothetical protein [Anaerolineae bacterium]